MLRELVEKKHTVFAKKVKDWEDAIRLACSPFVLDGTVEPEYAEDVIRCVEKYGPYIVLFPGVAMPHSQEGGPLVHGTGICFMRFWWGDFYRVYTKKLILKMLVVHIRERTPPRCHVPDIPVELFQSIRSTKKVYQKKLVEH